MGSTCLIQKTLVLSEFDEANMDFGVGKPKDTKCEGLAHENKEGS